MDMEGQGSESLPICYCKVAYLHMMSCHAKKEGNAPCQLCTGCLVESVLHLFFNCPFSSAVWSW
jgi:zinc-binding in reverse transcriptase